VLFFGTPHQGTDFSYWHYILMKLGSVLTPTQTGVIELLQRNSQYLLTLAFQYSKISSGFTNVSFCEEYRTPIFDGPELLVRSLALVMSPKFRRQASLSIKLQLRYLVRKTATRGSYIGITSISSNLPPIATPNTSRSSPY
jgi:hypothetical protein